MKKMHFLAISNDIFIQNQYFELMKEDASKRILPLCRESIKKRASGGGEGNKLFSTHWIDVG